MPMLRIPMSVAGTMLAAACAGPPLIPFGTDATPLTLATVTQTGGADQRGRFREIYCAVLEARAAEVPDHRSCDDALTRVGAEPPGSGQPVELGPSRRGLVAALVPGLGWDCIVGWLKPESDVRDHLTRYGYGFRLVPVDALSSSGRNARRIRDAVMAGAPAEGERRLVLVGYSKGVPDLMEALIAYPEIRGRVAAVVSLAGAVGGSPLANDAEQFQAELLRHFPGAACDAGDGRGVADLRPDVRRAWLARNPLPADVRYYSLVAYPRPERISAILQPSYTKLSRVDGRNDSQVIFYDQVIPGSTLAAYLDADHWAIAVPVARTHATLASLFVTRNAYPREALLEAVLRFVEEDLAPPR
jgi:hypothetical protein